MPLKGLQRATARPKGGVTQVSLVPATDFTPENFEPAPYAFREDLATWSEVLEDGLVRHTLTMELPAGEATRKAVDELTGNSAGKGLVAIVTLASGQTLLAGYSARFKAGYPLRVIKTAARSGSAPSDFPSMTIVLESVDADYSLPVEN